MSLDSRPFLSAVLVIVTAAVASAVLFATIPEVRDEMKRLAEEAKRLAFVAAAAVGIGPPEEPYAAAYARLGIPRLSASLLASSKISSSLERLSHEPCDKKAIYAFSEALVDVDEGRIAAQAYLGFGAGCPNGEGDRYRAAELLFNLGDDEKVIEVLAPLIAATPTLGHLHYLRGKALGRLKRYPEAIEDYKITIGLTKNIRDVGEWVFVEMANLYAAMDRPCDAASAIMAFVALDPASRNTGQASKMIEVYSARGCVKKLAPMQLRKL
jgi:tetratricopeptide (TPR) repeat protein